MFAGLTAAARAAAVGEVAPGSHGLERRLLFRFLGLGLDPLEHPEPERSHERDDALVKLGLGQPRRVLERLVLGLPHQGTECLGQLGHDLDGAEHGLLIASPDPQKAVDRLAQLHQLVAHARAHPVAGRGLKRQKPARADVALALAWPQGALGGGGQGRQEASVGDLLPGDRAQAELVGRAHPGPVHLGRGTRQGLLVVELRGLPCHGSVRRERRQGRLVARVDGAEVQAVVERAPDGREGVLHGVGAGGFVGDRGAMQDAADQHEPSVAHLGPLPQEAPTAFRAGMVLPQGGVG